ncbi:MAG TPA: lipid-A-disaccharide synthase [Verrucomicrobia bacterium]|nr:lipid-A-disaccharide synthase [Verrucomicrobiota bacterium]
MKRLMIVAGEVSGDQHAARLVRDLRAARADVELFGIGGDALRREGVRTVVDAREMAVVGFFEVLLRYSFFRRVFNQMTALLSQERPDALLLVDYPGFNLRLAAKAHAMGIPVLYYVSPQVWAWHKSRIPKMAKILDLLMVIFPFEVDVFRGTGLKTVFVGHPLVESVLRTLAAPTPELPWPPGAMRVAILPGSRRQEIQRILPVMLDAARELRRRDPETSFLIPAASEEIEALIQAQVALRPAEERATLGVVTGRMREVARQARAAMVCSGTATVETALLKCPMIVVYRTMALTYWFGRLVIRVKWLGMVNLIANRSLCPEFIQGAARPVAMADALEPLIADTPARQAQLDGLDEMAKALEGPGPGKRAGQLVAEALGA